MLKQTNKHINKEKKNMQIKFYPCISPWSRGSHLLFSCQKFFVRMQDVFRISPYTGHYSFHFELKIHMASLIK